MRLARLWGKLSRGNWPIISNKAGDKASVDGYAPRLLIIL